MEQTGLEAQTQQMARNIQSRQAKSAEEIYAN
jgi:hypothetical protein